MRTIIWISIFFSALSLPAQIVVNKETPVKGDITLAAGIKIPKVNPGYTAWLPEKGIIKGMVVFTHARRDTAQSEFIIDYALSRQLAVIYATTNNRLEFFFDDQSILEIQNYIRKVISDYKIPENNLLFCGMSLEGTRALKLAMYAQSNEADFRLAPRAIAICDAPLDMVRFYKAGVRAGNLNFNQIAANEGLWVSEYLKTNLGGTPAEALSAYLNYSPYSYTSNENSKLDLLKNTALRCYTEPDVNWWIETRRKDYYAMNAIDMAALVNELKIMGNLQAELITTQNKGYRKDGSKHPHSWNIVDERELIDWFIGLSEEQELKK